MEDISKIGRIINILEVFFDEENNESTNKKIIETLDDKHIFDTIIKKFDNFKKEGVLSIEEDNNMCKKILLSFNIKSKKYIVAYAWIDFNKDLLLINEILTVNYDNWKFYESKVYEILSINTINSFLPYKLSLKYKAQLKYISIYLLYILVNKAKGKKLKTLKIEAPLYEVCSYYYKVGNLFKENGLIKDFSLPFYEEGNINYKVIKWLL